MPRKSKRSTGREAPRRQLPRHEHEADDNAMATEHAAMIDLWDDEADRFWVRNNLLLVTNGVVLGAAVAADQNLSIRLATCAFGAYLSIVWLLMNSKGGYYVSRWRPVIERYEEHMLRRPSFPLLPLRNVRPDHEAIEAASLRDWWRLLSGARTPRMDAGEIMHCVILGFLAAWVALGSIYIGMALRPPISPTSPNGNQATPLGLESPAAVTQGTEPAPISPSPTDNPDGSEGLPPGEPVTAEPENSPGS